ncbi:MAG: alkaline phosphatase D family protein [Pseudomonadota bacterium]
MSSRVTRRESMKLIAAGLTASGLGCATRSGDLLQPEEVRSDGWKSTFDRVWLGREYWANPMEDWHLRAGKAVCLSSGGNRSVHSLRHQFVNGAAAFSVSVVARREAGGMRDGGCAIRMGARSELNEYRSNLFVESGLDAGVLGNHAVLGDKRVQLNTRDRQSFLITLTGVPRGENMHLELLIRDPDTGEALATLETLAATSLLLGNTAVVSNFSLPSMDEASESTSRYSFSDWQIAGSGFSDRPDQDFGPLLWAMYTLHDTRSADGWVMKMSVFTGPLSVQDQQDVSLQLLVHERWQTVSTARLDPDAWVATFRLPDWDASASWRYRVLYEERRRIFGDTSKSSVDSRPDYFVGTIRANPGSGTLRMAAMTCQKDYAFPYGPVAANVMKLDPDMVYFSGDQIYEDHGGFGIVRSPAAPAILCYLRKLYQFGWAFRECMRNAATVCLPDDHDVFQGNLWGEAGEEMPGGIDAQNVDSRGGYAEPVRMINVVHKTHTAHHPEPAERDLSTRGISTYFTELIYGDVSFAIIADRQWKSGPETLDIKVGVTGEGEPPEYLNPAFDRADLHLLGEAQERFLENWADDWRGHTLKAVLSQSVFSGLATHQPEPDRYLKYDFDSNGWPASARNRAIRIMRESKALHICGDTHLASVTQYGVDAPRDSNWAFCTPAIAAGWPRWWQPDAIDLVPRNRPGHSLANTGEYRDSFGNQVYVYAVGNPDVARSAHRYLRAHEKGSGFGFIEFDIERKTYTLHAFRFLIDIDQPHESDQFPGWPVTISQEENGGDNFLT